MKRMFKLAALVLSLAMTAACAQSPASSSAPASAAQPGSSAQSADSEKPLWPTMKNVELVVPATAGSGTDMIARALADYWTRTTGANFVITNDASGGYTVAYELGRTGDADGSRILIGTPSLPLTYYFGVYDHLVTEDFTIINDLSVDVDSVCIAVNAKSDYQTLDDLVDAAKAKPNALTVGTGSGNIVYALGMQIEEALGCTFRKVDGADNNERITNTLGGFNDFCLVSASVLKPYVENGDLRILAIAQNESSKKYPDIPTVKELGYEMKGASLSGHYILSGPVGMDEEMVNYIAATLEGFAQDENAKDIIDRVLDGTYTYVDRETGIQQIRDLCALSEQLTQKK